MWCGDCGHCPLCCICHGCRPHTGASKFKPHTPWESSSDSAFFVVDLPHAGRQQHKGPVALPGSIATGELSVLTPAAVAIVSGAGSAGAPIPGEGAAAPQPDEKEEPLEKRPFQPMAERPQKTNFEEPQQPVTMLSQPTLANYFPQQREFHSAGGSVSFYPAVVTKALFDLG